MVFLVAEVGVVFLGFPWLWLREEERSFNKSSFLGVE